MKQTRKQIQLNFDKTVALLIWVMRNIGIETSRWNGIFNVQKVLHKSG